jgi:hypothetical protein
LNVQGVAVCAHRIDTQVWRKLEKRGPRDTCLVACCLEDKPPTEN